MEDEAGSYFTFQDVAEFTVKDYETALTRLVEIHEAEVCAHDGCQDVSCSPFMVEIEVDEKLEILAYEAHRRSGALIVNVKIFATNPAALAKGLSLLWPLDAGPEWFLAA